MGPEHNKLNLYGENDQHFREGGRGKLNHTVCESMQHPPKHARHNHRHSTEAEQGVPTISDATSGKAMHSERGRNGKKRLNKTEVSVQYRLLLATPC